MQKKALKTSIAEKQKGNCKLSGKALKSNLSLIDTDRVNPKNNGGTYTKDNTRIVDPIEHMKRHGNYKTRQEEIDNLKTMVDGREQLMKAAYSANNRLLAYQRGTDNLDRQSLEMLEEQKLQTMKQLGRAERNMIKYVKNMAHPMAQAAIKIKGLGELTIAQLLVYVDIEKAQYASSLWAYCGYDKPSHKRYEKNVAGGGNKTLRSAMYRMADSMIKTRSIYRDVYDREKQKLANSRKIVETRNTQGKLIKCEWKDTKPSHRHGAAMRKMIKHFLADFWLVWRTLEGLETNDLYVKEKMGHTGIISPKERGWIY